MTGRHSLRSGLIGLGGLLALIAAGLGLMLLGILHRGMDALVDQALVRAHTACGEVGARFRSIDPGLHRLRVVHFDDRARDELEFLLQVVLAAFDGVEGGFWTPDHGFAAYAFPTYQGTSTKRDVPAAEQARIAELTALVLSSRVADTRRDDGSRESLILHACPVDDVTPLVAWTMVRVPVGISASFESLLLGVGVLFVLALVAGSWVFVLMHRWSQRVSALSTAIAMAPTDLPPTLPPVEERDLNRLVTAINNLGSRLSAAHERAIELTRRLAHADRVAALGRIAAVLAHEFRTPLGTIRLKAENALAGGGASDPSSWSKVLQQVERLTALVQRLMAVVQPLELHPAPASLHGWLGERVETFGELAGQRGVTLNWDAPQMVAVFDAASLGQALDNLLLNALQHTPRGGRIDARAFRDDDRLIVHVDDTGPGIPAAVRERLFEPFMTTRSDGTGLGLAIVQEIVEAHGGSVRCEPLSTGTRFELVLPWRAS